MGYDVVGYGAAAKAMTLLNFGKIKLDFIIDDNPLKQGLLTPGMDIPIRPVEHLKSIISPITVIPLAWNFYDEIKKRTIEVRGNSPDIYIKYFPKLVKEKV